MSRSAMVGLLERDLHLAALRDALTTAADGHGLVMLVTGEPGIGKSSLIRSFLDELPPATRVFVGSCDDLTTPRAFGPLRDAVRWRGGPLAEAMADPGNRDGVFSALPGGLSHPPAVSAPVIEAMPWGAAPTLEGRRSVAGPIARLARP